MSVLPGCGPMKTQRLRECNVVTLADLLRYTGPAPHGVNVTQMKHITQQALGGGGGGAPAAAPLTLTTITPMVHTGDTVPRTKDHNWYNLAGHILNRDAAPTRVHIGKLIVAPYGVVIETSWRHAGTWRSRAVTPLMLACTFVLWSRDEIVSDDSDDEEVGELSKTQIPLYMVADTTLPVFRVNTDTLRLNDVQKDQLRLACREVRMYQQQSILSLINR